MTTHSLHLTNAGDAQNSLAKEKSLGLEGTAKLPAGHQPHSHILGSKKLSDTTILHAVRVRALQVNRQQNL